MSSHVPTPTGIEAMVCEDIARRQAHGVAKYGQTLMQNPLPLVDWLQHAYEEALDLALYLKRAQVRLREEATPPGWNPAGTLEGKFADWLGRKAGGQGEWKPSGGYVGPVPHAAVADDPPVLDPSQVVMVDGLGFMLERVESGAPLSPCPAADAMGAKACQDRKVCPEECGLLRFAVPPCGGLA